MAINYTTLFANLGKIIGRINSYAPLASSTLPTDLQAIIQQFGTGNTTYGDAQGPIQGIVGTYANMQTDVAKWRQNLKPYGDKVLTDVDTVISQLTGLLNTDIKSVLLAILQDMVDNSQTVKGEVVTLGAVTAASSNHGNGTALVDATLDGYNAPIMGGQSSVLFNGLGSQLAVPSETMQLTCTADSFTGGLQEGNESWAWAGGAAYKLFDWHSEGSGVGPRLSTANGQTTVVQNLGFTTFTSNAPSSWTIASGAAGTDIFQETTQVFRGGSALRFAGTGALMPAITQAITASNLQGRRRYLFTIQACRGGNAPGGGNLTINFTGTGYTPASSEQINVALGSLGASYGLLSFYINLPAVIPSNFTLSIAITGANLANGANIYLDSGTFTPVAYHGGINCQVIAGNKPWTKGDRLWFTVANSGVGNFQEYFRRVYQLQLPSKLDGSQTINDALAT